MIDEQTIRYDYAVLRPSLNERGRRLFAAAQGHALGYGGVAAVAWATQIASSTACRFAQLHCLPFTPWEDDGNSDACDSSRSEVISAAVCRVTPQPRQSIIRSKGLNLLMVARAANADKMLERIARAAGRAGCRVEKVRCARGGHGRTTCVRRLRINGRLHAVHALTNVHARRNRRVRYTKVTLERRTLETVQNHLFYISHSRNTKLMVVPSRDLLKAFFNGSKRTRHTAYINLDGTRGRIFDLWQYNVA
jgi:hypothetical protein